MRRTIFILLICSVSSSTSKSQNSQLLDTTSTNPLSSIVYSDGKEFVDCIFLRLHETTHPNESSLITAGIIVGSTASLFFADQSIRSLAARNHSSLNDDILNTTEQYGATGNAILLSGSIYCAGLFSSSPGLRKTGTLLIESLFWTGAVTTVIKYMFGRSRPYMNEGNTRFHGIQFSDNYLSLPSGHSAVAFTLTSVLSERVQNVGVSIGLYSLAGMTALARVYHDEHWLSDVFLGAVIGTSVGTTVARDNKEPSTLSSFHLNILPNSFGFTLEF